MRRSLAPKHAWALWLAALVASAALGCGSTREARPRSQTGSHPAGPIRVAALRGRIVFSRRDDIWSANADGSGLRRLTSARGAEFDPSWSPDGTRIVYRDSRRGINVNDELYVMDADGSHRRNLTHTVTNEWSPAWSPDGRAIAYYSGQLFVMNADGSAPHPITKIEGEYPA